MPRVPTYDSPQVTAQAMPDARLTPAPVEVAQNEITRQSNAVDQAANKFTDAAFNIGLDMQKQANALRIDDALNQAREAVMDLSYNKDTGYTNLKGRDALERASGMPLADEYGGELNQRLGTIEQSLGNDAQRREFRMRANDLATQFKASVMQHENQEFKNYALSTSEGIISTRQREIGLNYNNPALVEDAVTSIRAQAYNAARLQGKSAEWAEMQARKMASNAHLVAIGAALEKNDPMYADAYMKKFAKDMDADDILRANGLITKQLDAQMGLIAGRQIMSQAMPSLMPNDAARLSNLAIGDGSGVDVARLTGLVTKAESGGKDLNPDGSVVTSPRGAKGSMQVMDATNKDPGFGVRPAADDSLAERARVGRDYLQAMLQRYGGNVPQALAAYNAGPGALDAAIREANKNGGSKDWLAYMPAETRKYVTGIVQSYASGGGAPRKPTELELHAQVDQLIPPTRIEANKAARQVISQQFADLEKAKKQSEDDAVANVQSALIANGGRFVDLPLNLRANLPPGKYDDMLTFADKVAKGQPIETNWQLYYTLKQDPQLLSNTNLMALRDKLADSEFKQLSQEQLDVRNGKTEHITNLRSGRDYLSQFMREAGIDPTPKDDDKKGAEVVGRIWNAYEERVRASEQNLGRKLKPEELKHEAAALFSSVEVNRPFWFNKTLPAAAVAPDQVLVVPDTDRRLITDALRKAGRPVTETAIQDLYRRGKNALPYKSNG